MVNMSEGPRCSKCGLTKRYCSPSGHHESEPKHVGARLESSRPTPRGFNLDTLSFNKTARRCIISVIFILTLGYLLTNTFEYSCVYLPGQNYQGQGCTTGEQKKIALLSIWFIVLIGYIFYELRQEIEIIDRT